MILSLVMVLGGLFFLSMNEAMAQMPISEMTIGPTNSSYFKGQEAVSNCNTPANYFAKPFFGQSNNTALPHYLNNAPDEFTWIALIYDEWGFSVMVGAPGSGYPQSAVFPSGDAVKFKYYGCAHPTVIEIF